jgi:hypothetical protein
MAICAAAMLPSTFGTKCGLIFIPGSVEYSAWVPVVVEIPLKQVPTTMPMRFGSASSLLSARASWAAINAKCMNMSVSRTSLRGR